MGFMSVNETDQTLKSGGQIAYEAYNKVAYGSEISQVPVVWPDLQPSIKAAWEAAAKSVADRLSAAEQLVAWEDEQNRNRIGADTSSGVSPP